MAAILETKQLDKHFGGVLANDKIDFSVEQGELRCIIGPNGAGKSTFFQLLCGIFPPDGGHIFFKGEDITKLLAFQRVNRGLGLTFQTNRTFLNLTVRQNIESGLHYKKGSASDHFDDRFNKVLKAFDLEVDYDLLAQELPHHKMQWLEICMVLAGRPTVILLDEPTAGMSPDETTYTAKVLKELCDEQTTIIVVEHDIAFVRQVAQKLTVLHQGRIIAEGSVKEITEREDIRQIYLGRA